MCTCSSSRPSGVMGYPSTSIGTWGGRYAGWAWSLGSMCAWTLSMPKTMLPEMRGFESFNADVLTCTLSSTSRNNSNTNPECNWRLRFMNGASRILRRTASRWARNERAVGNTTCWLLSVFDRLVAPASFYGWNWLRTQNSALGTELRPH